MNGEPFPSDLRPGGVDVWLRGIRADYVGVPVFEDLSLRLRAGAWVCLLGPSGVGKTTLLRLVAGLAPSVAGTIEAGDGRPIAERVAYMAQQDLLLPWLTAAQNVGLGARLRGERIDTARARDLLARVGLAELASCDSARGTKSRYKQLSQHGLDPLGFACTSDRSGTNSSSSLSRSRIGAAWVRFSQDLENL